MKYILILFVLVSCTKQPKLYKVQVLSTYRHHLVKTISDRYPDTTFTMNALVNNDTIILNYHKGSGKLYFDNKDSITIDSTNCRTIMALYDNNQHLLKDINKWYIQIMNK